MHTSCCDRRLSGDFKCWSSQRWKVKKFEWMIHKWSAYSYAIIHPHDYFIVLTDFLNW